MAEKDSGSAEKDGKKGKARSVSASASISEHMYDRNSLPHRIIAMCRRLSIRRRQSQSPQEAGPSNQNPPNNEASRTNQNPPNKEASRSNKNSPYKATPPSSSRPDERFSNVAGPSSLKRQKQKSPNKASPSSLRRQNQKSPNKASPSSLRRQDERFSNVSGTSSLRRQNQKTPNKASSPKLGDHRKCNKTGRMGRRKSIPLINVFLPMLNLNDQRPSNAVDPPRQRSAIQTGVATVRREKQKSYNKQSPPIQRTHSAPDLDETRSRNRKKKPKSKSKKPCSPSSSKPKESDWDRYIRESNEERPSDEAGPSNQAGPSYRAGPSNQAGPSYRAGPSNQSANPSTTATTTSNSLRTHSAPVFGRLRQCSIYPCSRRFDTPQELNEHTRRDHNMGHGLFRRPPN